MSFFVSFCRTKKVGRKKLRQKTKDRNTIILHLLDVHVACPVSEKGKKGIAINEPDLSNRSHTSWEKIFLFYRSIDDHCLISGQGWYLNAINATQKPSVKHKIFKSQVSIKFVRFPLRL